MADATLEKKEEEKAPEKQVAVINQGNNSLSTSKGLLRPNQSLELPESEANRLTKYKSVVKASDITPSIGRAENLQAENAKLKGQISGLNKEISDLGGKNSELDAKLKEFLAAGSKKDLEALQEKHGEKA